MYSSLPSEGDKIILVWGVVLSSNSLNIVTHQYIIGSIFKNCWQKTTHKPQTDCSSRYGFDLLTQLCFTMYSLFRFVLMGFSWVSWCLYWSRSFGHSAATHCFPGNRPLKLCSRHLAASQEPQNVPLDFQTRP